MKKKDWFQLWMAFTALALITSFNNCSRVDFSVEGRQADITSVSESPVQVENLPPETQTPIEKVR